MFFVLDNGEVWESFDALSKQHRVHTPTDIVPVRTAKAATAENQAPDNSSGKTISGILVSTGYFGKCNSFPNKREKLPGLG